jgi:hypothetical protein
MLPHMPGPEFSKTAVLSGPSSLPMYNKQQTNFGPPPQFTQSVPPMGQPTSVPLVSAGLPPSNTRHNELSNIGPSPSQIQNIGPPPMEGFVKK